MQSILKSVDHLVLAAPSLEVGMDYVEKEMGIRPQIGGQHLGKGTWNALVALGHSSYLEVIAPDPKQEKPTNGCWMGVDQIETPQLIHWAAKVHPIHEVIKMATAQQLNIGQVSGGSRTKMNGDTISWTISEPVSGPDGGIIPFLIDWEDSVHPAESLEQKCKLIEISAEHPEPQVITQQLKHLGIHLPLRKGALPRICAIIKSPKGIIAL
ncbi:MAG: VOC family protein [Bacteroidota bacterium]